MCRSPTIVVLVALLVSVGFFADATKAQAQPVTPCSSASLPVAPLTTTCSGPATLYKISLLAFKLRPSSGPDSILVSSSKPCDAGAVAPGAEACQFGGSNLPISADTYTGFVLEINRTFVASGTTTLPALYEADNASKTIAIPDSSGNLTFTDIGSNNMRIVNSLPPTELKGDITIDFQITLNAGAGVFYTFDSLGACTKEPGFLDMTMSFKCISGACPSGGP